MLDRRSLIAGAAAAGLLLPGRGGAAGLFAAPALVPIEARRDRMYRVTVCLRPFLPTGPRIEVEKIAGKRIVHHYGHGGSGWSLSWGSAAQAVPLALAGGAREIAVIGAGAIGLTSAITAQRMGAQVTIYAKERFPHVRSGFATGSWTPSSRIAMAGAADAAFEAHWQQVARASYAMHQSYLGVAGDPVEWTDRYLLSDVLPTQAGREAVPVAAPLTGPGLLPGPVSSSPIAVAPAAARPAFLELDHLVPELTPQAQLLAPADNPFAIPYARKNSLMTFNVASYCRSLEAEFEAAGGRFVAADFKGPKDLRQIREAVAINCTGYAARALFGDERLVPVRGQIAWLLPQQGATYGVYYDHLSVLARRDGIVVQALGGDDYFGFDDASETADMPAAYAAIDKAAVMLRGKS